MFGSPAAMDRLLELSKRYNLKLIEDAAEAIGSEYKGRKVGSFGLIGCLSFNGNKIITTGGGGALLTNDEAIAKKARYLITQAKDPGREYIHGEVGYNYRLTNVAAAIGLAQLELLERHMFLKRDNFEKYSPR